MSVYKRLTLTFATLFASFAFAQVPDLPDDVSTRWVVNEPEEVVGYFLFDPINVRDRLPSNLRFISVGELASGGVPWAKKHLTDKPSHESWGISFLEIISMTTFNIDGRSPNWPQDGATALWAARVAPLDPTESLGYGRLLLVLEFWLPDSQFVAYMREKGHYATHGSVGLSQPSPGTWLGSIDVDGLSVIAQCTPLGPVTGGSHSSGIQTLVPPKTTDVTSYVTVAFAGHQTQTCVEDFSWRFDGTHAFAQSVSLGPSTFQFGYELEGGAVEADITSLNTDAGDAGDG